LTNVSDDDDDLERLHREMEELGDLEEMGFNSKDGFNLSTEESTVDML